MNTDKIKELGYKLMDFSDENIDDLILFLEHFPRSGRAPKGMKRDKEKIDHLHRMVEMYREHGLISHNINAVFSYYQSKDKIDHLVDSFAPKKKQDTLKLGRITFTNRSRMSESRFLSNSKEIFEMLKGLKGFHRLAIEKPIEISFLSASEISSKAKYKSIEDKIVIKESAKMHPDELYGHLQYIVMHELGHRVEHKYGLPEDFVEYQSYTTKYSRRESMAGSEAFAELFALSHWKDKYPEYEDKINIFNEQMNGFDNEKSNSLAL